MGRAQFYDVAGLGRLYVLDRVLCQVFPSPLEAFHLHSHFYWIHDFLTYNSRSFYGLEPQPLALWHLYALDCLGFNV